jgi:hypothetical protein
MKIKRNNIAVIYDPYTKEFVTTLINVYIVLNFLRSLVILRILRVLNSLIVLSALRLLDPFSEERI